jgi:hypothetical protein
MFKVGHEVLTRYGVGVVVCVGRVKPHVYVRVHSRPHGIFMLDAADVEALAGPEEEAAFEADAWASEGDGRKAHVA